MDRVRLNLFLPKKVSDALKSLSEQDGRAAPELARAAIVEFVAKHSKPNA